jgi:hypothetical protein
MTKRPDSSANPHSAKGLQLPINVTPLPGNRLADSITSAVAEMQGVGAMVGAKSFESPGEIKYARRKAKKRITKADLEEERVKQPEIIDTTDASPEDIQEAVQRRDIAYTWGTVPFVPNQMEDSLYKGTWRVGVPEVEFLNLAKKDELARLNELWQLSYPEEAPAIVMISYQPPKLPGSCCYIEYRRVYYRNPAESPTAGKSLPPPEPQTSVEPPPPSV